MYLKRISSMHLSSFIPQLGNIDALSKYENVVEEDVAVILWKKVLTYGRFPLGLNAV